MNLLEIEDLTLSFQYGNVEIPALDHFSLTVRAGERVGLVGESGAGKSLAVFAILGLLKSPCVIKSGHIRFKGREVTTLTAEELRALRGGAIAMIFQNPLSSLNPVITIGDHLIETARAHSDLTYQEAYELACEKLAAVKISEVKNRMRAYPHEFSGGMRQRIVIACALMTKPELMLIDEPTTALDVTIQAEIMELLYKLSSEEGCAYILVSHDLGLISQVTDRMCVLYAGKLVEINATVALIKNPRHPYTQGLLACLPELHQPAEKLKIISGRMPALGEWPQGCRFHPRCSFAKEKCRETPPNLTINAASAELTTAALAKLPKKGAVRCFYPLH